ncbi:small integral membrane protein 12 isoform X2 [Lasioglossum baleicum]|uniref:small integral membrane protein 12 isoform X2 n=1 Tax=Lasioglossum baleicum TaxID=434251 RepID=UPI003FCEBA8B
MWPILVRVFSRFGRYIQLPIAGLIGIIGYNIEGLISDRYTPSTASIKQQREDRQLEDTDSTSNKKVHRPLEINLPPSLSA